MQFKTEAANAAYLEIIQHVGKCVQELESDAFNQSSPDMRSSMLLQSKQLSTDGLCQAITTAYQVEVQAIGLVAHFSGQNGG